MFSFYSAVESSPTHCSSSLALSLSPQAKFSSAALLSLQAPWQPARSAAAAFIVLWARLFTPASLLLLVMQLYFVICFAIELEKAAGNVS